MEARYGDPIGLPETAALAVAFKALLVRNVASEGDRVTITEAELERARGITFRVDATPERMTFTLVEGQPPDQPRYAVA